MTGRIVLFGGPAGAGKSTLARAWASRRPRGVHIELDRIRALIVGGLADPQVETAVQEEQYRTALRATCVLATTFAKAGYDVAVDDVLEPSVYQEHWQPALGGVEHDVVIVRPSLDETLRRSSSREKSVLERHIRDQHERCAEWPVGRQLDTGGLSVEKSLAALDELLSLS